MRSIKTAATVSARRFQMLIKSYANAVLVPHEEIKWWTVERDETREMKHRFRKAGDSSGWRRERRGCRERCMRGGGASTGRKGSVGASVNDEGTRDELRGAGMRRGCKV